MKNLKIEIETTNSAFEENGDFEIARILKDLAERFENGSITYGEEIIIRDINGNKVVNCIAKNQAKPRLRLDIF